MVQNVSDLRWSCSASSIEFLSLGALSPAQDESKSWGPIVYQIVQYFLGRSGKYKGVIFSLRYVVPTDYERILNLVCIPDYKGTYCIPRLQTCDEKIVIHYIDMYGILRSLNNKTIMFV